VPLYILHRCVLVLFTLTLIACGTSPTTSDAVNAPAGAAPSPAAVTPTIQPAPTMASVPTAPAPSDTRPTSPTASAVLPSIGMPVQAHGVTFTVLNVIDSEGGEKKRPVMARVRIKNVEHDSLIVEPGVFAFTDSAQKHYTAGGINYMEAPPDERELAQGEQVVCTVLFGVDGNAQNLILLYTPIPDVEPIQVQAIRVKSTSPSAFADLDLAPLLIQAGDLPVQTTGGQVITEVPPQLMEQGIDPPTQFAAQFIQHEDYPILGTVYVVLYEAPLSVDALFTGTQQNMFDDKQLVDGIGERALFAEMRRSNTFRQLSFTRCHAFAMILISAKEVDTLLTQAELSAYARRLDERLAAVAC
jgi:hypothetical protein